MKRIYKTIAVFCTATILSCNLSAVLADSEATPTDLQELTETREEEQPEIRTEGTEPEELVVTAETVPVENPETVPEGAEEPDPEQELLDAGYVKVTIIREQGTNLYQGMDDRSTVAGALAQGEEVWAKPQGGFWAEILKKDPKDRPLYFNLNNAALLLGEIKYDLPIRKVTLKSTLEGQTEIEEGTEVTITARYSGFQGDEITEIRWQYRPADDPDGEFRDIEGADGFSYTYLVNEGNIHHEWRIILVLKP